MISIVSFPKMSNHSLKVVALICVFLCVFLQRYSVDLTSRPDEANIPLSTMEPEQHIDTVSQNGQSDTSTLCVNNNVTEKMSHKQKSHLTNPKQTVLFCSGRNIVNPDPCTRFRSANL